MGSSAIKPTVVIVPGSFSPPEFYDKFVGQLSKHGYDGVAISLPSVGGKKPATMEDDAAAIAKVTSKLADEGKDVILVSHSYGGIPASESAKGLSRKERQESGKKGGISALLYVTALVVAEGASLGTTMGDAVPDHVKVDGDFMTLGAEGNAKSTFSDLPLSEGLEWASRMPHHSTATFGGVLTYPAYRYIHSTYLFTENDQVIPFEMQKGMVDVANQGSENPITTYSCKAGHFPFLTMTDTVIDVVRKIAGEAL